MDPKLVQAALDALEAGDATKALELLKQLIASAAGCEPSDPNADPMAPGADPAAAAANTANAAAASALCKLTGKESVGEAVEAIAKLHADVAKLQADQQALEQTSRIELVGDLVKLGAELPATAWEGDPKDRKPCVRLQAESVDSLRSRVAALRASRPAPRIAPPETAEVELSAEDQKRADAIKDPAQKERFIALRKSRAGRAK